ncbi:MAG: Rne/Rng family ribonuclease [Pseudomonadota bacterium]
MSKDNTKRILINKGKGGMNALRIARVSGQTLEDLEIETPNKQQNVDKIFNGEVVSIQPSLEAAFINFGVGRNGFLPLKEIAPEFFPKGVRDHKLGIKDVLFTGQKLLVQVNKEERGSKGAALSTYITLAGAYLVLMPNNPKAGGISRRIDGSERDMLKDIFSKLNVPEGTGAIIRTAGMGKALEELQWDLNVLLNLWEAIKQASKDHGAPYLIHQDNDMVTRTLRDHLRADTEEVLIDDKETFEKVIAFIERVRPDFVSRVKYYEDSAPLFSRFQIEKQIEAGFQRNVRLPSGGEIVIDRAEALTAIDVNSAQSTKGEDIEETALHTNIEAALEVARQLRLRDIGGLIVIDFIDMDIEHHRHEVENCLLDALSNDRARTQIQHISRFGLLEMSRQCLRSSLGSTDQITCPRCHGQGSIRSVPAQSITLMRLVEDAIMKDAPVQVQLQVPVDVATYILNEQHQTINAIEKTHNITVVVVPNPHMQTPEYDITCIKKSGHRSTHRASFELVASSKNTGYENPTENEENNIGLMEPAVKNVLPPTAAPVIRRKNTGFFSRLFKRLFKKEEKTTLPERHSRNSRSSRYPDKRSRSGYRKPRQGSSSRHSNYRRNSNEGAAHVPPPSNAVSTSNVTHERNNRRPSYHDRDRKSNHRSQRPRRDNRRPYNTDKPQSTSVEQAQREHHLAAMSGDKNPVDSPTLQQVVDSETKQHKQPEPIKTPPQKQPPKVVPFVADNLKTSDAEQYQMIETKKGDIK